MADGKIDVLIGAIKFGNITKDEFIDKIGHIGFQLAFKTQKAINSIILDNEE